jgi:hypothetical protein
LLRSSDSAQLSSWAVRHSSLVASRLCGSGMSKSPSATVACLKCRLNSVAPDGDGAARRWVGNAGFVPRSFTGPLHEQVKSRVPAALATQFTIQTIDAPFDRPSLITTKFGLRSGVPRASASRMLPALQDNAVQTVAGESSGRRLAILRF